MHSAEFEFEFNTKKVQHTVDYISGCWISAAPLIVQICLTNYITCNQKIKFQSIISHHDYIAGR